MTSVGLIGCGGIAQDVVAALRSEDPAHGVRIVGALARSGRADQARAALCGIDIVEALEELLARRPAVIAEVAGRRRSPNGEWFYAAARLPAISVGAPPRRCSGGSRRRRRTQHASRCRRARSAHRRHRGDAAALTCVRYRAAPAARRPCRGRSSISHPHATHRLLRALLARSPAHPQNANVAAAVALAGLGFDATEVELVADPDAPGNVHEIEAEGAAGRFAIQLQGKPSRSNPKTSALAAMSVARALINAHATIVI